MPATKPKIEHTLLVATELTTEDLLDIFISLARRLGHDLQEAEAEAESWRSTVEMYRSAWHRELEYQAQRRYGNEHEIDALVMATRDVVRAARYWQIHENGLLNKDPFWMVPEFKESDSNQIKVEEDKHE